MHTKIVDDTYIKIYINDIKAISMYCWLIATDLTDKNITTIWYKGMFSSKQLHINQWLNQNKIPYSVFCDDFNDLVAMASCTQKQRDYIIKDTDIIDILHQLDGQVMQHGVTVPIGYSNEITYYILKHN